MAEQSQCLPIRINDWRCLLPRFRRFGKTYAFQRVDDVGFNQVVYFALFVIHKVPCSFSWFRCGIAAIRQAQIYAGVGSSRVSKGFFTNTMPFLTVGLLTQQVLRKS